MAIDFPSSPTAGQIFNASPGVSYIYMSPSWQRAPINTALPRNYIINPCMQVSQENGDTESAVVAVNTTGYYPADQWWSRWSLTGNTASAERVSLGSVGTTGSHYQARITMGAYTPAAGDYAMHTQRIEGQRMADLRWGTASAVQVILTFRAYSTVKSSYPVTHCISIANSGAARTYIAEYTITGVGLKLITLVIPGDTTGTWLTTNGIGMTINWTLTAGSTFQGVAGWQAGGFHRTANALITTLNSAGYLDITDVGLYADPYKTGVAPPFVTPWAADEERRCQRYWYPCYGLRGFITNATQASRWANPHPVPMRAVPTYTLMGTPKTYDGVTVQDVTSLTGVSNTMAFEANANVASGLTLGRPSVQYYLDAASYIGTSARL